VKTRKAQKRIRQLGRPRKEGVPRTASGRIKHGHDRETESQAMQTATEARQRVFGVSEKDARLPSIGSALGRLQMAGNEHGLSSEQRSVAEQWGETHIRYCRVMGFSSPNPKSPAMIMVARGVDNAPSPDDEEVFKIRRRWSDAYSALARHQLEYGKPSPYEILRAVVIEDYMPTSGQELGNLRIALNILSHLWRRA
jgi:hypothetical protein